MSNSHGWPVVDTDTPENEKILVEYFAGKTVSEIAAHKFWPGDYDDFSCALSDAGWSLSWHAPYWFIFQSPSGGPWGEYIEGDLIEVGDLEHTSLYRAAREDSERQLPIFRRATEIKWVEIPR